ncbi:MULTISPECIES: isochorismate synthase [Flavobacteriaceae]|uniref:isochorismate synthase n=1 Tax=Flavobacteriaceae TaxID=49546 RepID=UPI001FE8DEB0|nr:MULTISPECIES: isochorismate synthase [Allomuricauda]MDC6364486.1 isochorismate synthase [Muricauda sp. AC10]
MKKKLPFSVYRKPGEEQITGLFQSDDKLYATITFEERGFVFAPFSSKSEAVLIHPDEILTTTFLEQESTSKITSTVSDEGKFDHLELVKSGVEAIKKGELKKVVLSRKLEVKLTKDPINIFKNLLAQYSNAFCYLFYHPKVGMWCGATPETLVQINNNQLTTMSLAATLPNIDSELPAWGTKEVEEQQMVSDYIREKLGGIVDELEISETESVKAGNLWHLRSKVTASLPSKMGIKQIIEALHPTPAVCGIPTQKAKAFILSQENYDRSFYTGFLGELNLRAVNEVSLFVNLRCMELNQENASIFVGGGITVDSEPESEWVETQNKSRTMLNII